MTDQSVTPISLAVDGERQTSTNFFWRYDSNGQVFDLQTTVRDNVSPEMIQAHIESIKAAIVCIHGIGGISKNVGGAPAPAVTTVATSAPAPAAKPAAATPAPATPAQPAVVAEAPHPAQTGSLTFPTVSLLVTETNGKKMFKVTGGQWLKYGVTIWPEVLKNHTDIDALQGGATYDFSGYVATYALNDQGKPSKITKLEEIHF